MTAGWKVCIAFVVSGLLAYCVGYSMGSEAVNEPPPPVVIICSTDTAHVTKIAGIWACIPEGYPR